MSDRGKTAANPDGFARILTMGRRKYACQNHGSDYSCHPNQKKKHLNLSVEVLYHNCLIHRQDLFIQELGEFAA